MENLKIFCLAWLSLQLSVFEDVFDIYINEMSQLESGGFVITVEGIEYTIIVTMVQMIDDNLGLDGMLGYVKSFTANFPCRLCKLRRVMFNKTFVEQKNLLRSYCDHMNPMWKTLHGMTLHLTYHVMKD
jgi:hypothetical protein